RRRVLLQLRQQRRQVAIGIGRGRRFQCRRGRWLCGRGVALFQLRQQCGQFVVGVGGRRGRGILGGRLRGWRRVLLQLRQQRRQFGVPRLFRGRRFRRRGGRI